MATTLLALDTSYSGNRLLIFSIVWVPVQVIAVALRYFARWLIKGPWGLDDILIFVSLFLQFVQAGVSIGSVKHGGVGYHLAYLEATNPGILNTWRKYLLMITMIYFANVNIPKLAILALYNRLFPQNGVRLVTLILATFLVMLTISTVMVEFLGCIPFNANWNVTVKAHCVNKEAFYVWGSIPNMLTDLVILVLPMRTVWNLNATRRMKIGLTITFAVGSFGFITSVIHLTVVLRDKAFADGTWSAVPLTIWAEVEPGVYLISACLPTYRPLLERIGKKDWVRKLITRKPTSATRSNQNNTPGGAASNIQLQSHPGIKGPGFRRLQDAKDPESQISSRDIMVTKDFVVIEHSPEPAKLAQFHKSSVRNNFDWGEPE